MDALSTQLAVQLLIHLLLIVGAMGIRQLLLFLHTTQWQAIAGGWCWMCAPFLQHEMLNGTSELLSSGLLAGFTWLMLSIWEAPTPRKGIHIGIVSGILLMSSAYNPFFMLLILTVLLLHRLTTNLAPLWTAELLKSTGAAILSFLPFLTLVGWVQFTHGALETFSRRLDWKSMDLSLPDSYVNLEDWVSPASSPLPAMMFCQMAPI